MTREKRISGRKLLLFTLSVVSSAVVGFFSGEPLRLSPVASEYIGLLFSILAASVFAVVSIVGDPSMLLPGRRRLAWESAEAIQIQIQKLSVVFSVHLIVLLLLVISEIVRAHNFANFYWVFNLLGGLATLGFLLSFGLPFELGAIQRERLRSEIAKRPKE